MDNQSDKPNKQPDLNNRPYPDVESDDPITNKREEPIGIIEPNGQEQISIKLPGGMEVALNSSVFDVQQLCSLALGMFEELNGDKPKEKRGSYYG